MPQSVESRIGRAGAFMAARGIFGLVWLDRDLVVTDRHGMLVDFIAAGRPITDSLPALVGLEGDLSAQQGAPESNIELPAISIVGDKGATPRLNLIAYWDEQSAQHLLLFTAAPSRSDLQMELSRQMRARLMAEQEVIAKSRDLERANRDLEDYASIISHDLASPLRALRYMADDVETALGSAAPPEATAKLAEMRRQSARMSGMLTALLDYASVGRKEEIIEEVDTAAMIAAIVASIPRSSGLEIDIQGQWPRLTTLAAPLDLVLRNLIDNAVKHHDRALGCITVTAQDTASGLDITVADDGPGIAGAHQAAVFLPFRTLHDTDDADPSESPRNRGMGLALVARTLESVGGAISLQSAPEHRRGTTFCVRWPHAAARPTAPLPSE